MTVSALAGRWIDRIKINDLAPVRRDGRTVWVKRRRPASHWLVPLANAFFRLVGNPVSILPTGRRWQRWEVDSFRLLHGDAAHVCAVGRDTVEAESVPGESLCRLLDRGDLTAAMMCAAGLELRHAHRQTAAYFESAWSHGDPHLGNFVFDSITSRCRLIDFEVRHPRRLSAAERHAEDLLVPLLDLSSRCADAQWIPFCLSFLSAYDRPELLPQLCGKLVLPSGPARCWWAIRTNYCRRALLRQRLHALRAALPPLF